MLPTNHFKIIVIDDNTSIQNDFKKVLLKNSSSQHLDDNLQLMGSKLFGDDVKTSSLPNFTIDTASQGDEGVEMILKAKTENDPYALAFVDIRMPPGWDGVETIKNIWKIDKNIQIVICTAYSDYSWEETIAHLGMSDNLFILKKPFCNTEVIQLACSLTKKRQNSLENSVNMTKLEINMAERGQCLNAIESRMRATFESTADGIMIVDTNRNITEYNEKLIEMMNLEEGDYRNSNIEDFIECITDQLISPLDIKLQMRMLNEIIEESGVGLLKMVDNKVIEYNTQPYEIDSKIEGRVWCFRDVSKREKLQESVEHQSSHDYLTGLNNRLRMNDEIIQLISDSDKNSKTFCMLVINLDRFKRINDNISYSAGDEVLRLVSSRLKLVLRENDLLARIHCDKFVIIIKNIKDENMIIDVCKKISLVMSDPFQVMGHDVQVTASIGISVFPKDGRDPETLLKNAKLAMFIAKKIGANKYQFYQKDLGLLNSDRLNGESELRHAIANNEFILHYQPQYILANNELTSVEALIRWNHPVRGLIYPINFIPLAEESGLIIPLGDWVIRTACKQAKAWQLQGLPPIRVAVNVTSSQFRQNNFVSMVAEILNQSGIQASFLEMELTENMIIDNVDTIQSIAELRKLGIQISLDDFGTGHSSLSYLREIPIDRIKIDQSYVQNFDKHRGDEVIIKAMITMAKNLNLEVLAEGVETREQFSFLKMLNCDQVQGFYFSEAVTAAEIEQLVNKNAIVSD